MTIKGAQGPLNTSLVFESGRYNGGKPVARRAAAVRMTYAEYLEVEAISEIRHEFLDGDVWAMSGGTPEHSALAAAMLGELRNALGGKPCRVFTSDLRTRV